MALAGGLLLAACGTTTSDRALSGAAIGAGAGAVGGALLGFPVAGAAVGAAAGAGVGAATTPVRADTASGSTNADHVVTSYVGQSGVDQARDENLRTARQTCHGGAVLIDEERGTDGAGAWLRLHYGCLADSGQAGSSR